MGSRDDCRGERPRKANEGPRHAMEEAGENRRPQDKPLERSAIGRRVPGPAKALEALPAPYPFGKAYGFRVNSFNGPILSCAPDQAAWNRQPRRLCPVWKPREASADSRLEAKFSSVPHSNRRSILLPPEPTAVTRGASLPGGRSPPSVLPGCPPGKGACRIPLCPPVDLRRNRRFPPPRHRYVGHPDLPGRRQRRVWRGAASHT